MPGSLKSFASRSHAVKAALSYVPVSCWCVEKNQRGQALADPSPRADPDSARRRFPGADFGDPSRLSSCIFPYTQRAVMAASLEC